ncbi:MAG: hypothetical protein RL591_1608 [Planctomycetota bacterium]
MELECHAVVPMRAHGVTEEHGFAVVDGARLAYVYHRPRESARLRVIIIGPIGAERERAYRTLVDLSRALTHRGSEVFRYDHRGLGESEGEFDEATIGQWAEDARRVVQHLHAVAPLDRTTVLVGVRVGALIASELFAEGCGDAAVFLGHGDGQTLLRDASRRALVADLVQGSLATAQSDESSLVSPASLFAGYAAIAAGREARVDGYLWKPRLIAEAAGHTFTTPNSSESRPWLHVDLRGSMLRASPAQSPTQATTQRTTHASDSSVQTSPVPPRHQDLNSNTAHRLVLHVPKFWESSPQLVPEDACWFNALGEWLDRVGTFNAVA